MAFTPLDPTLAWKAIEGYQNELAPEQKVLDAFYRQHKCPRCEGDCRKEMMVRHAFAPGTLVPRSVLRCHSCACLFDPHSNIIVEMGNLAKVEPAIPIIRPAEE